MFFRTVTITLPSLPRDKNVFASYAGEDYERVRPFVDILRATDLEVFIARDSIHPGELWQEVIKKAINQTKILFVFWTKNASLSTFVRDEYELALVLKKPVVPVMLDDTPLPIVLERIHGIDFRKQFALARNREQMVQEFYSTASGFIIYSRRAELSRSLGVFLIAILSLALVGLWYYSRNLPSADSSSIPVEIESPNFSPVIISRAFFTSGPKKELRFRMTNVSGKTPNAIGFLMKLVCDDSRQLTLLEYGDLSVARERYLDQLSKQTWPLPKLNDNATHIILIKRLLDSESLALTGEKEIVYPAQSMLVPSPFNEGRCSKRVATLSPVMAAFTDGSTWSY